MKLLRYGPAGQERPSRWMPTTTLRLSGHIRDTAVTVPVPAARPV
jgi:hypothetical protein